MDSRHILVIDDEEDILMLVQLGLELSGWTVTTTPDPTDGVSQAASTPFDAILLDMTFPGVDGRDVLRQLRQTAATREIPVLLVSGKVQSTTRRELLDLGAAGVIEKPFDATTLADQVATLLKWPI